MKRGYPPLWCTALVLALLLVWRLLGAPTSAEALGGVSTGFWQARALLPARVARVLLLWQPAQTGGEAAPGEASALGGDMLAVYLPDEGAIVRMPLERYVCGVVAAEVPARYHAEALKAQAVAARTRAVRQRLDGGCALHPGADVCGDSGHCQGYASDDRLREQWGGEYAAYDARVTQAVSQTADELILYEGQPITVLYHAVSGGVTEAAQAAFSQAVPYLVSVPSAGEEGASGYQSVARFTFEEAAALLAQAFPELSPTAEDVRRTLAIDEHTQSGRVQSVRLCDTEVAATALRRALGLRSTWFSVTADADGLTFEQRGYGHGVGMSQAGANAMAADGTGYRDILTHYYTGVAVQKPGDASF